MFCRSLIPQFKGNRRDQFVIISDMLSFAITGVKKTELMYKAGLSSAQLQKYVRLLFRSELLELSNRKKRIIYVTTAKGKCFLETFVELARLLG
jgi:predicted transcriptional regulator